MTGIAAVAPNRWTKEQDDLLRRFWGDGLSASQTAAEIGGVTRNAVIGRVHRLGLSGRVKKAPASSTPRTYRPRARAYISRADIHAERITRRLSSASEPTVIDDEIPIWQRKTIFELEAGDCRWIVGESSSPDHFYCAGEAIEGSSYCWPHHCRACRGMTQERRTSETTPVDPMAAVLTPPQPQQPPEPQQEAA